MLTKTIVETTPRKRKNRSVYTTHYNFQHSLTKTELLQVKQSKRFTPIGPKFNQKNNLKNFKKLDF